MLLGATLAWSAYGLAAQDYVIDAFDTPADPATWNRWWGAAAQVYEFDYTTDAAGKASSGALKATVEFDLTTHGGDNQLAVLRNFDEGATLDGTKYTNLVFDLRWDAASAKNAAGNYGYLEYGFRNADWSQNWLGGMTIASDSGNNWIHVVAPINPTAAKLDTVAGIVLKLWAGGSGGLTGTTTFWLDNVKLIAKTETAPPPPPSLTVATASPGLRLAASAAGQQYQRQSIHTLATDPDGNPNNYSWVASASPVTYSLTIQEFPDATHSGFQAHIFLAPENALPYGAGDASVDWNANHVVFLQIVNNSDGTATGRFMYKINQPGGNSMLWNTDPATGPVGTLATISDASARGTWSLVFKNNTDITLTTPSGTSTNFAMPVAAAALFSDPLIAYFGTQPNNAGNIGQSATFSHIQITGGPTTLNDNFASDALDATKWQLAAADAPGVVQVPPTAMFWLKWTAPATGFVVQSSTDLAPGSWKDANLGNVIQVGSQKMALVTSASLPAKGTGFFRLFKP